MGCLRASLTISFILGKCISFQKTCNSKHSKNLELRNEKVSRNQKNILEENRQSKILDKSTHTFTIAANFVREQLINKLRKNLMMNTMTSPNTRFGPLRFAVFKNKWANIYNLFCAIVLVFVALHIKKRAQSLLAWLIFSLFVSPNLKDL